MPIRRHHQIIVKQRHKALPASINGLWKADLIIGRRDADRWVAASVKINVAQLEAAQGIRSGIVPSSLRHGDAIREERGLIVCPIPHDGAFMQKFYEAWRIVRAFLDADAKMPPAAALPRPEERYVADILTQRRDGSRISLRAPSLARLHCPPAPSVARNRSGL